MNKVQLVGRLTRDPELRTTGNGISVCSFTVAVNRRFRNAQGEYEADFINCVAWRQSAELLAKYFTKGRMVGIVGSIQTRNYEKDGQRVYVTEVTVEEVHFVESKNASADSSSHVAAPGNASANDNSFDIDSSFMAMPSADDDLPF